MFNNKKEIIYILGAGRSGTTLLDIIIGNADDIFSAGEINRFTKRNGVPHDARDENVVLFWKQIVDKLNADGYQEPGYYYPAFKKIEYHSGILAHFLPFKKKLFEIYSKYQQSLFSHIFETVDSGFGKNSVVDSSKYPLRALALSKIFKEKIKFIYIQRNPLVVVNSFQKMDIEQPRKSKFGANAYLLIVNALSMRVVKKVMQNHKVSIVSFERLLADPIAELTKIEKDINVDLATPKKLISQNKQLKVGYLFDGNRLRLNDAISLKKVDQVENEIKGTNKLFYPLHKLSWYKYKN